MTMIVNIRGTNGSGKTTMARHVLGTDYDVFKVPVGADDKGKMVHVPLNQSIPSGIIVVGNYRNTCGGMDTVKTQAFAKEALEQALKHKPRAVVFEGVLISTIFQPWLDWSRAHGGMVWAFMDTPLELCLSRVQERNGGKPVKEDQIAAKHRTIERVRQKATEEGERVLVVPSYLDEGTGLLSWIMRNT